MTTENSSTEINTSAGSIKPKNVPTHIWERFKGLEKRTNEVTQRSTEKRIKHLQQQVMKTVTEEFTSPEDKEILQKYDVKFGPLNETFSLKKRKTVLVSNDPTPVPSLASNLSGYMDINQHLQQTDHSRPPPPTALEKRLNAAVKEGNLTEAEALSDQLATREASERIVAAFDAKKFIENKKVEDEADKTRRKRKLDWGFEAKQKWETKGNM